MPFISEAASAIKSRFGFQDHSSDAVPQVRSSPDLLKSASRENLAQSSVVRNIRDWDDDDGVNTTTSSSSSGQSFEFREDPSFWKDHNVQVLETVFLKLRKWFYLFSEAEILAPKCLISVTILVTSLCSELLEVNFYHFMNPETLASKCLISVCYVWLNFSVGLYAFVKLDLVISRSQKSYKKCLKVSKELWQTKQDDNMFF